MNRLVLKATLAIMFVSVGLFAQAEDSKATEELLTALIHVADGI